MTFPERDRLVQKVKGVCLPTSVESSNLCSPVFGRGRGKRRIHKAGRGAGPTSQLYPVSSSLAPHSDSPTPLCTFTDDHSACNVLLCSTCICWVIATHSSSLSLNITSSWKPPLVESPCNVLRGSLCFFLSTLIPLGCEQLFITLLEGKGQPLCCSQLNPQGLGWAWQTVGAT